MVSTEIVARISVERKASVYSQYAVDWKLGNFEVWNLLNETTFLMFLDLFNNIGIIGLQQPARVHQQQEHMAG